MSESEGATIPEVLPEPSPKDPRPVRARSRFDISKHKPNCRCPACFYARERRKEALADPTRDGGPLLEEDPRKRARRYRQSYIDPSDPKNVIVVNDNSRHAKVAEWAILKADGLTNVEIAAKLAISPRTLRNYLFHAHREGWLKIDDPLERLHTVIVPKVIDNIEYFIDRKSEKMTIETAKGTGVFQTHQAVRLESDTPQAVLALNIQMAPPNEPKQVGGSIVGTPKMLDGIVEEG